MLINEGDASDDIKPIPRNGINARIRRTIKNEFTRFVVDYRAKGERKLIWRSTLVAARMTANDAIDKITDGQAEVFSLKSADAHAYIRARAKLDGAGEGTKID